MRDGCCVMLYERIHELVVLFPPFFQCVLLFVWGKPSTWLVIKERCRESRAGTPCWSFAQSLMVCVSWLTNLASFGIFELNAI